MLAAPFACGSPRRTTQGFDLVGDQGSLVAQVRCIVPGGHAGCVQIFVGLWVAHLFSWVTAAGLSVYRSEVVMVVKSDGVSDALKVRCTSEALGSLPCGLYLQRLRYHPRKKDLADFWSVRVAQDCKCSGITPESSALEV